jgi:hypothetical protein
MTSSPRTVAQRPHARTRIAVAAACAVGLSIGLAACSGSSPASAVGTPLHQTCTAVGDVLANGPDPDADPVGYAEAQPIPLSKITTSDTKLKAAIDGLASAYRSFANSNGSSASKAAVKSAARTLDAICPGAAS